MQTTINADLSSSTLSEDGLLVCNLPSFDPETGLAFTSEEEVQAFIGRISSNPNYFRRVLSAAELAVALEQLKEALSNQIDAAVFAIYARPMALGREYEAREKAAADFKAAGYTGDVPAWLASFATPAGMEPGEAADLILSQAAEMRVALDSLGALRMSKYVVRLAETEDAALTAYADIMTQIAAVAADLT